MINENLTNCPICKNERFEPFLQVDDFSVSKEVFSLMSCLNCSLRFTNPRPQPVEIGKYYKSAAYISHTNSKKGLLNKLYQFARSQAIASKWKVINRYQKKATRMLDYGCGTGEFLKSASDRGWLCYGLEPDDGARDQAIKNYKLNVYPPSELETIAKGQFDLITLWHVLEHVHKLEETVNLLSKALNEKGILCIAVPNPESNDARHYGKYWAAYDVPRHLYHFTSASMHQLLDQSGLKVIETRSLFFDPFYISLLSEKYKSGHVRPLHAFWQGLRTTWAGFNDIKANSSLLYICTSKA